MTAFVTAELQMGGPLNGFRPDRPDAAAGGAAALGTPTRQCGIASQQEE